MKHFRRGRLTRRIRQVLLEGPSTIPELMLEIREFKRQQIQGGMWGLTHYGHAEKNGRWKRHWIYELTAKGRAVAKRQRRFGDAHVTTEREVRYRERRAKYLIETERWADYSREFGAEATA